MNLTNCFFFLKNTPFISCICSRVTFKFERNLLSCKKIKQYGITAAGGEAAFKNTVHGLKIAVCNLHKSAFCHVYHSSKHQSRFNTACMREIYKI